MGSSVLESFPVDMEIGDGAYNKASLGFSARYGSPQRAHDSNMAVPWTVVL
jgi:hypothetical protein